MSKTIFRPFWSFDVVKTEKWLSAMHAKGYALQKIRFAARQFVFEKSEPMQMFYRIVFDKHTNGAPEIVLQDDAYDQVCFSKNFYVLRTEQTAPATTPSYDGFLKRNKMIGMVTGYLLLFFIGFYFPIVMITTILLVGFSSFNLYDAIAALIGFIILLLTLLPNILIFFTLRKTNRELEKLCGDTLDLSFTLPKDTLISKSESDRLRKSGLLIKRTKLAWQYAPDKVEIWLEKMAQDGYRLIKLSKLGLSFYFLKVEPYKSKFHVDYQNKTDPSYYNLNNDAGWKLFFTSLSRFQNLSVWGQEYTDEPPMFYSDSESQIKHARNFALTYSLCFFPVCILYILVIVGNLLNHPNFSPAIMIVQNLAFLVLILELGFFATRTVLYYFRVKKAEAE
ncbi:MAG: DUF2812 domain-containing protein [Oscillospiraceae bacterium]|nr:DUF2812 domain-containing protein [Oscillospiraceae bacterium]